MDGAAYCKFAGPTTEKGNTPAPCGAIPGAAPGNMLLYSGCWFVKDYFLKGSSKFLLFFPLESASRQNATFDGLCLRVRDVPRVESVTGQGGWEGKEVTPSVRYLFSYSTSAPTTPHESQRVENCSPFTTIDCGNGTLVCCKLSSASLRGVSHNGWIDMCSGSNGTSGNGRCRGGMALSVSMASPISP